MGLHDGEAGANGGSGTPSFRIVASLDRRAKDQIRAAGNQLVTRLAESGQGAFLLLSGIGSAGVWLRRHLSRDDREVRPSGRRTIGTKKTSSRLPRAGDLLMLCSRPRRPIRTTLDLANAEQVKSVRRRLRISATDLARIVDKIGTSLAAIEKEVELERLAIQQCNAKNAPASPE